MNPSRAGHSHSGTVWLNNLTRGQGNSGLPQAPRRDNFEENLKFPAMKATLKHRLSLLTVLLVAFAAMLLARLAAFPVQADAATYLESNANNSYRQLRDLIPDRGRIFDRNGQLLAGNVMDYNITASPNLILNKQKAAAQLGTALDDDQNRNYKLSKDNDVQYTGLARGGSTEVAHEETNLGL